MQRVLLHLVLEDGRLIHFGPIAYLEAKIIWLPKAAMGWYYESSRVVRAKLVPFVD